MEKTRPLRESKYARKMSITSQMRNSALHDNLKLLESSRFNNHSEFENVFDPTNANLNALYQQTIKKCKTSAIMHVGLCLDLNQTIHFLKQLALQSGQVFQTIGKISDRKELLEGIIFAPFWYYKIQNCSIIFWVLEASLLNQAVKFQKITRLIQIFTSFPQLIITDAQSYNFLRKKRVSLCKSLNFQQFSLIFCPKFSHESFSSFKLNNETQQEKLNFIDSLDRNVFIQHVRIVLKKNSLRCYYEPLKINLYILSSLSWAKVTESNWEYIFENLNNLYDIFEHAARDYLSDEVQKRYEIIVENFKNSPPRNEKELENQLSLCEQQLLREVKKNVRMLNQTDLQKSSMEATEKKLSANQQQILSNNKENAKKQNYQILNELYEKLLNKFDKGRYASSKERAALMAEDLQSFMEEYEKKAVKSTALFGVFNTYMKHNRTKYYQKVQALQDQIDQNKKNQNFDGIFDPIEMKKKVLFTLEKEVKQMEAKKMQIESQTQRLKKLQRRIELGVRMDTEGQELYEAESTKTMKAKQVSPRFKNLSSGKNYPKAVKADKKKNKCLNCCKCSIF